jgi:RNA polymerase sigma-70 factor (ECF subfamily)
LSDGRSSVDDAQEVPAPFDFELAWAEHRGVVAATIRNIVGPGHDTEDLVQTAFLEVFRSQARFRGECAVRTWVVRIAVNTALQEIRRRKRKRWLRLFIGDEGADAHPAPGEPRDRMESRSALAVIGQALASLSEKKRIVFVLAEVEGMKPSEIALALNIPVNTARSRYIAARREVTDWLAEHGALDE